MATLEDRLRTEGSIAMGEVARIVRDVFVALADLHSHGHLHRAIRPAYVVVEDGRTLLLGPGERRPPAKKVIESYEWTLAGFGCMAPEQVRGMRELDASADVYGVGVVAFLALTGKSPFGSANALSLITQKLDRDPPSLTEVTGKPWPPAIERFSRRALARQREARFASAAEALEAWQSACAPWLPQPS
jgi:eukaryotic-like serine/threonine-protein kinase